jgi:hypothetical protein
VTLLESALDLAARGFWIFPIKPWDPEHAGQADNGKKPAHVGWQAEATRDPAKLTKWFSRKPYNIGIFTSKFGDGEALCVVDIDVKKGKRGDHTLLQLEFQGMEFPPTLGQATPTGGSHLVYRCAAPLRQGADVLGTGLDIRSKGGYIVGPGSIIEDKTYNQAQGPALPAVCPTWLVDRLGVDRGRARVDRVPVVGVDPDRAVQRAQAYLTKAAGAVLGSRGSTAYKVAAQLSEYGCTSAQAYDLMSEHWNAKCDPPMPLEDLSESIDHAFRYCRAQPGSAAAEAVFDEVDAPEADAPAAKGHPFAEISREYAFIKAGAFVMQETTDEEGNFTTERLAVADFHAWFANKPWARAQEKPKPISVHWMEWANRRQYDGVVFMPEKDMGPRWYNLWRGFTVAPAPGPAHHPALDLFLEHALKNVCGNSPELFRWLMGWFAHMVQRPWEKPLVATVFKGAKGVGKNALIERVGYLLGPHFLVADDERYLLGNFNSHLESNLCFVLDEAAWAGDKRAEGKLKGLITGSKHLIEHKGKEARTRKNLSRIVILGNEEWLVPASQDERRFAVFHVGDGRLQDRAFFIAMREGMEQGGYAHLLRYLFDYDLTGIEVNDAPNTQALVEQKHASLEPLEAWWLDCLFSGEIAGGDFGGVWPPSIPSNRLRESFKRWASSKNVSKSRLPTDKAFGTRLKKVAPHFTKDKASAAAVKAGETTYKYPNPGLEVLRADWENYIGGEVEWTD